VRGTRLLKSEVETALWELVAAGLVTADGFDNLRALIDPRRRAGHGSGRTARPRHSTGRWALLYGGDPADRSQAIEATCWMLLRRYGIVFRELLARETILPTWREVLIAFRRLEDRGEIRGGRFVTGFIGEQFALPIAVDSLRAARKAPLSGENDHGICGGSAESGRGHRARRPRPRNFRTARDVPRRHPRRSQHHNRPNDSYKTRSNDLRGRLSRPNNPGAPES
jgi:hypothetical protein